MSSSFPHLPDSTVKNRWGRSARALRLLESAWEKPFIFDVADAAGEPTTYRKNAVQPVAMANPRKSGTTRGRTRKLMAREHSSPP